jgi:hypothetical protein
VVVLSDVRVSGLFMGAGMLDANLDLAIRIADALS